MVRAWGVMQGCAGSCLEAVRRTTLHTGVPHTRCLESPPGFHEQVFTGHIGTQSELGSWVHPGEPHRLISGGQAGASASPPGTGTAQLGLPGLRREPEGGLQSHQGGAVCHRAGP